MKYRTFNNGLRMTTIYILLATPCIIACIAVLTARCVLAVALRRCRVPRRPLAIQYAEWQSYHAYLLRVTTTINDVAERIRRADYYWGPHAEELVIHPAQIIETHITLDVRRWRWAGITWTDLPLVAWWFRHGATRLFMARLPRQFWEALEEYMNAGLTYEEVNAYTVTILMRSARYQLGVTGMPPAELERLLTHRLVLFLQRGAQLTSFSVREPAYKPPVATTKLTGQQPLLH